MLVSYKEPSKNFLFHSTYNIKIDSNRAFLTHHSSQLCFREGPLATCRQFEHGMLPNKLLTIKFNLLIKFLIKSTSLLELYLYTKQTEQIDVFVIVV